MSLEETINKLVKAVKNSSNAAKPLLKPSTSDRLPPTYPWDVYNPIPKGCDCIHHITESNLPYDPLNCTEIECEGKDGVCVEYHRESTTHEIGYRWTDSW